MKTIVSIQNYLENYKEKENLKDLLKERKKFKSNNVILYIYIFAHFIFFFYKIIN